MPWIGRAIRCYPEADDHRFAILMLARKIAVAPQAIRPFWRAQRRHKEHRRSRDEPNSGRKQHICEARQSTRAQARPCSAGLVGGGFRRARQLAPKNGPGLLNRSRYPRANRGRWTSGLAQTTDSKTGRRVKSRKVGFLICQALAAYRL